MPAKAPRRLLIVDDERDLVEPLALRLSASGRWDVSVAFDGDDGLRKAQLTRPHVVLLDLSMPELDGWEVCRRLREDARTSACRVVIMTAWATPELDGRAAAEGAERLLLKPFEEQGLLDALDSIGTA